MRRLSVKQIVFADELERAFPEAEQERLRAEYVEESRKLARARDLCDAIANGANVDLSGDDGKTIAFALRHVLNDYLAGRYAG